MGQGPSEPNRPPSFSSKANVSAAEDTTDLRHQPSSATLEDSDPVPPYQPRESPSEKQESTIWLEIMSAQNPNPFSYGAPIPANVRTKNVILFGETGAGKSSIVNLMAGAEVATTSPNLEGCTLESTEYSFLLSEETPFRIYDTVGLNEPQMGVNTFLGAIEKAHKLVKTLHAAGGIDLLLFCVRGGRITSTMQRNYRLFFEFLGDKQIPLAMIVTNLENEDRMENWWERNEKTFQEYEIHTVSHACVTGAPARLTIFEDKRRESLYAVHRMLREAFSASSRPYVKEERSWFMQLLDFLRSIFLPSSWFAKKDLSEKLETRCGFSREDAQRMADLFSCGK